MTEREAEVQRRADLRIKDLERYLLAFD